MKIIDLTHPIEEGMITFGAHWHPVVSIKQLGRINMEGRESREITFGTHTGTHVDAPLHFIDNGKSIDKISLDNLIGPIQIIDYSHLKENDAVTKEMLMKINVTERMLFKFGWGKYWNQKKFYHEYPHFTKDAAEFLVSKNVKLLAYDTPSPDDSRTVLGSQNDSEIHKIFLRNSIILVEYLANLNAITNYMDWNIVVAPLKIRGADGSPARVFIYK